MELHIHHSKIPLGWLKGNIGGFRFQAKVFDRGSKFGINQGRVSKLSVWDGSREIISYDRGWSIEPACDEHWKILWALLNYFETLPVSDKENNERSD